MYLYIRVSIIFALKINNSLDLILFSLKPLLNINVHISQLGGGKFLLLAPIHFADKGYFGGTLIMGITTGGLSILSIL